MEDNKLCLEKQPLNQEMLDKIDAYWRAANYLSAGQLYLLDNPLLREPLTMDQIKKKIVGHWGTVPGQNFVYAHCNRVIKRYDRFVAAVAVNEGQPVTLVYLARAVTPGTYQVPQPQVESMYVPQWRATGAASGPLTVTP